MDTTIVIAIIAGLALLVSAAILANNLLSKNITRGEHEEFKTNTRDDLRSIRQRQEARLEISAFTRWVDEWRGQVNRDFDRIEEDIRLIDAAKPSAGELQEAMKAVDVRVTHLEEMIRMLINNSKH